MASSRGQAPGAGAKPPSSLRLDLARNREAPAAARAAVSGLCDGIGMSVADCDILRLLVSELVSNAVVHSTGPLEAPIGFCAHVKPDGVCVSVSDAGQGSPPEAREPGPIGGGYGLYLLQKAARRWGTDHVDGTRVWFELPRADSASAGDEAG